MRVLFVFVFIASSHVSLFAQDSLMFAALPDSIVITATRYQESVYEVGQRIAVWSAEDISRMPVSSFDELLKVTGGVEVFSRSGFGVQSDITIRGGTFNGVLLLIDGIRFNDAQTGHFLTDFPIPLSQIERIEVLRGPATVVYGPDALNGVIHVITKSASGIEGTDGLQITAGSRLGSHGLRSVEGDANISIGDWLVGGGIEFNDADGETVRNEEGIVDGPNGVVKTDFNRLTHSLYFRKQRGPVQVYGRFAMDRRDFNAFHFYTVSALDFSRESTKTIWGQLRLSGRFSPQTDWTLNTVLKSHTDEFDFNPEFPKNEHTSQHFISRFGLKHEVSDRLSLSTGVSGWSRRIDSNNLGEHDDFTIGGYVHSRFQPLEAFILYTGVRLDHDGAFGTELTPQINAVYRMGRLAVRGNVGRAVRAPNYVEQYINFTRPPQRGRNYGNPELSAEKAWSRELGIDVYPMDGLSINTTAFQRNTSNLIDFAQISPIVGQPTLADSVLLAQNIASVKTQGLEIDAHLKKQIGRHEVQVTSSYTRLNTDLDEVKEGAVFKYASSHARTIVQGALQWRSPFAELAIQTFWKERQIESSYSLVNIRAAVPITLGSRQLTLSADVRNVFDLAYTEVLDAPMPGRWVMFGAHIRL
ncbi:MAG: TonB-dependent receptor plug domain-containing protein [Rhodothermales bacterium]